MTLYKKNKIVLMICSIFLITCQSIIVQSPSGNFQGRIVDENGKHYRVFQGIPFAKPPVGNLRFKGSEPLDTVKTNNTIDATNGFSKKCIQNSYSPATASTQSEDCLYLNVFSPLTESDNKTYPVMVWIHGGGLIFGSASQYPVAGTLKNIVSRGVVFVSINYRLGLFGFYTSKSTVAPGNYGLLDQVVALKWVQKNIQSFGGDPSKVTIFGESAGGTSVSLLTISPLSKGLFQQAIMMSGSAFAPWSTMADNQVADMSGRVTESVGCRRRKPAATNVTCPQNIYIKNVSPDELKQHEQELECMQTKTVDDMMIAKSAKSFGWAARIDGHFLPDTVEELMKKRNPYNLVIGVTKDEYASFAIPLDDSPPSSETVLTEQLFHTTPELTSDSFISCQNFYQPGLVNFTARLHYSRQKIPTDGLDERHVWFQRDVNMKSALWFWIPAYKDIVAAIQARSNVYVYSFDWKNAITIEIPNKNFTYKGATHASELFSLFTDKKLFGTSTNPSRRVFSHDENVENTFGLLWTNFAKFGNPTPNAVVNGGFDWKSFNMNDLNYLSLDFPNLSMKKDFLKSDAEFWTVVIPQLQNSVHCST